MHREDRTRTARLFLVAALLPLAGEAAGAQARRVRTLPPYEARIAEHGREGAMRLLRAPACQRVLADFTDAEGRSLADRLVPFALSPDAYLAMIPLLDGEEHELCRRGHTQLFTNAGVARVFVCRPFLATMASDRRMAEVYMIHEMLHTLGLGENPPSSQQITQQVRRRCVP
jgi:hypothetical protein